MPRDQHSCPYAMCPRKFSLNKNSHLDSIQKSLSRKGLLCLPGVLHSWAPCHGSPPVTTAASYLLAHHERWERVSHRRNKCLISSQKKVQGIQNFLCSKEEFSKAYIKLKKRKTTQLATPFPCALSVAALTCSRFEYVTLNHDYSPSIVCILCFCIQQHYEYLVAIVIHIAQQNWGSLFFFFLKPKV